MSSLPGLYLHIPYCRSRCPYCDFVSCVSDLADYSPEIYTDLLLLEAESRKKKQVHSIYAGGGTPSVLGEKLLCQLISRIIDFYGPAFSSEVTVEMNPADLLEICPEKLIDCGINRVSIGYQRSDPLSLKTIGRSFYPDLKNTVRSLKRSGLRFSLDFIYGIPGDSVKKVVTELQDMLLLSPDHVSLYLLEIKPETEFFHLFSSGNLILPDDDQLADIYSAIQKTLLSQEFQQYEISSFCRNGQFSRHNSIYFDNNEYIGLGAGAWSFQNRLRSKNHCSLESYREMIVSGKYLPEVSEYCDDLTLFNETLMMGLRKLSGTVPLYSLLSDAMKEKFDKKVLMLKKHHLLRESGNVLFIPEDQLFKSSGIIAELMQ